MGGPGGGQQAVGGADPNVRRCDAVRCGAMRCDAVRCDAIVMSDRGCNALRCDAIVMCDGGGGGERSQCPTGGGGDRNIRIIDADSSFGGARRGGPNSESGPP